ncbi:DUF2958 domain-containing protein [Thiocystis violacea]|uniref:DUF2958 domain-containing protein n=1 Tax=Thiocystis violacea TaxID=13725 RepID=UPI0019056369|nr:DUF2958 domain-containing protein [Thiocystis violacea]MBK1724162.1 hypothetical protein [Thiocystis violacea]
MDKGTCRKWTRQILGAEAYQRLLANGQEMEPKKGTDAEPDFWPVAKLFLPGTRATWLLTELDPQDERIAFGLADLGMGFPELGSVWLPELWELNVEVPICTENGKQVDAAILAVEKDCTFVGKAPLSWYAREARAAESLAAIS